MSVVVCQAAVGCLACTGRPRLPHEPLLFFIAHWIHPLPSTLEKDLRNFFAPCYGNLTATTINGLSSIALHPVFRQDLVILVITYLLWLHYNQPP
jgi:hypothetical protein